MKLVEPVLVECVLVADQDPKLRLFLLRRHLHSGQSGLLVRLKIQLGTLRGTLQVRIVYMHFRLILATFQAECDRSHDL